MLTGTVLSLAGWGLCLARAVQYLTCETRDTMARFKREKKLYHLKFEDDDLAGFECTAAGLTLKRFVEFSVLLEDMKTPEGRTEANIEKQFTLFASALKSWNLDDDDDQPVPCTYEGLAEQDFDFIQAIMRAWMQAIVTVSVPLVERSNSGGTSPEESTLGLAGLSQSLAS